VSTFRPDTAEDVAGIVRWAVAQTQPLELIGGGSKRGLGRPSQTEHVLDLSALSGIVAYEPAELVLTAGAGTPLADIAAAVAAHGQMLAFEPPDWRGLLGTAEREPTLGGTISCNLAGPRRIKAGAARDHLLGFAAVNGRGEVFKAGGKVVKNVTGYDLCKLVAGAHGTLAALTELSVKVLPRPELARTVVAHGLDDATAIEAMTQGLNSEHEVSAAAHLPAGFGGMTLLRVEGPEPSVAHRVTELRDGLGRFGDTSVLDAEASAALWRRIADVGFLAEPRDRAVWRVSVPPASGAFFAAAVAELTHAAWLFDWGGGLVWVACAAADGGAAAVRAALAAVGDGHATLIRAPEGLRAAVEVLQPLPAPLAALSARVKHAFDPLGVLNPGRLYPGV
jgi:glycolate oxidase FAD binding subunit